MVAFHEYPVATGILIDHMWGHATQIGHDADLEVGVAQDKLNGLPRIVWHRNWHDCHAVDVKRLVAMHGVANQPVSYRLERSIGSVYRQSVFVGEIWHTRHMIRMLMGHENCGEITRPHPESPQPRFRLLERESAIYEEQATAESDQRAVAPAATT